MYSTVLIIFLFQAYTDDEEHLHSHNLDEVLG